MDRNRGGRPRHPDVLTPAEWRVLDALHEGGTNAEIGARLGLSPDTVKYHISNMLAKLELRDRRELAAWRPVERRGRLGAVLAVPAAVWAVVGRPLVWVGLGTAALAGVVVVVVALVALEAVVESNRKAPATAVPSLAVAPTATPSVVPAGPALVPSATPTAAPSPTPAGTPEPRPSPTPSATGPAPGSCASPTDPTCIRAVYRGAPGDYAQVADIPAEVLLTPGSDSHYHVRRGQQVTVVTAAPLPTGWTRFYLVRDPGAAYGAPSPVSSSQLIKPVGTTYTFTVTADDRGASPITFDLTAAKPHPARPTDEPVLGDVVVTTSFRVRPQSISRTCRTGTPVPDPAANPALAEDCEALLAWRDTLAGTATLDWHAGIAMTSWEGVTVAGTPSRVTKLELANAGFTGDLSGLVGELEGLTELRLNGNALTGRIPSKVALLTRLTHVYLGGNALTGCVPPSLRAVANQDLATLGLPYCGAPVDVSYGENTLTGEDTLTTGTYQVMWDEGDPPLVFDIPPGLQVEVDGWALQGPGEVGLILQEANGESFIALDVYEGDEWGRYLPDPAEDARLEPLFDRVVESAWVDAE